MSTWSSRRKSAYGLIVFLFLTIIFSMVFFVFIYKKPNCFDGKINGNESGIDCGGSCQRLCQSSFLPPKIGWGSAKFEKLTDGIYNVSAYIINPNPNGAAINVPYKISIFDSKGILIIEKEGNVDLYPHRNSLAFQSGIITDKRIPAKAIFEFTNNPEWFLSEDKLGGISIVDKKYEEDQDTSSLEVTIQNNTLFPYQDLEISAILYDDQDNVIGFSQTKIDDISEKGGKAIAPFTWPYSREGLVKSIEILTQITPTIYKLK